MTILLVYPLPSSPALKALKDLAIKVKSPDRALRTIGASLLKVTRDRFESQTDPDGKAWAPHSKLTREIRGTGQPILRKSGRLFRQLNYRVDANCLRLGPNAPPYDAVHQFGATIRPKNAKMLAIPMPARRGVRKKAGFVFLKKSVIPPRPYIGFGPKDEAAVLRDIEAFLALPEFKGK